MREEIIQTFQSTIFSKTILGRKKSPQTSLEKKNYEREMEEELDAADFHEKNKKAKERKFKNVKKKIFDCLDPRKTKMVVEFSDRKFCQH